MDGCTSGEAFAVEFEAFGLLAVAPWGRVGLVGVVAAQRGAVRPVLLEILLRV